MVSLEGNFVYSFYFCLTLNLNSLLILPFCKLLLFCSFLNHTPSTKPRPKRNSTNLKMQNDSQANLLSGWNLTVLMFTVYMSRQIPKVSKVNGGTHFISACVHGNCSVSLQLRHVSVIFNLSSIYRHYVPQF